MHHISNFKDIYFKNKQIPYESVNNIKQLKKKNTEFFQNNYNEENQTLDNESKSNILSFLENNSHLHQHSMNVQRRIKYFSEYESSNSISPSLSKRLSGFKADGVSFFNMKTIENKLKIMNDILPSACNE